MSALKIWIFGAMLFIGGSVSTELDIVAGETCLRPCLKGQRPKRCAFRFKVSKASPGLRQRPRLINGGSPGPSIEICLGDRIEVTVLNALSSEEVSFHWHGLRHMARPHMDGVSMISQCPIMPYTSFRYEMVPESTGTHFYHAHSVQQQGDGLYGSLIVRGPEDDVTAERVLLISASSSDVLSELLPSAVTTFVNVKRQFAFPPKALILNGQTNGVRIPIESGGKCLLRIVNAIAFNCPVILYIAQHDLDVRACDGNLIDVTPATRTHRIIIFPGERFDASLEGNGTAGNRYAVTLRGLEDCRNLTHEASLDYVLAENEFEIEERPIEEARLPLSFVRAMDISNEIEKQRAGMFDGSLGLLSLDLLHRNKRRNNSLSSSLASFEQSETSNPPPLIETFFLPFDVHRYDDIVDEMTDYSFNIYDPPYYPSFLSAGTGPNFGRIAQVNRMSFEYPSSPVSSRVAPEDTICLIGEHSDLPKEDGKLYFRRCTQILQLAPFRTFDIVLIDEGYGDNVSHTFHAHGYDVEIVDYARFDKPISRKQIVRLYENNKQPPHEEKTKPLLKDTFVVPNKGYLALRIFTNNIGYWLWESRGTGLYGANDGHPPMQFVLLVGNQENLPIVPIDFPTCGDHKDPASIFYDAE